MLRKTKKIRQALKAEQKYAKTTRLVRPMSKVHQIEGLVVVDLVACSKSFIFVLATSCNLYVTVLYINIYYIFIYMERESVCVYDFIYNL